ncbi:MAG: DEAD/DEAH box helicase [Firmicutes bacterium]|nr:DEAD/DEAH box helicase [Bacillota bacterium]
MTAGIATYRGLKLDPFQQEAIAWIQQNQSVLVSAPTGTGKTLVADYLIEHMARLGRQVVYTAPIKALSNQKFKEFKRLLGEDAVGIVTGDVVINPAAPVLIMTTEIFRNLLHLHPARLDDVAYCVFDEIHYIDDPARGSVWEESLIFMPPHMRFLGLSATIPNVDELADWVSQVHGHPVRVVRHTRRAVPLTHYLFEATEGITTMRRLVARYRRYAERLKVKGNGRLRLDFPRASHVDLVREIHREYLPCLFFTFSRRRCELGAAELGEQFDFLRRQEKARVQTIIDRHVERYGQGTIPRLKPLARLLARGIGYHHAGLMPVVKDIVEDLFEQRLIRVLYCTETFAVGLNFPCRSVCFDSVTKWDGETFRPLTNREYFQMAGRAGRRGIDDRGYVFTLVDFNRFVPEEYPSMREEDVEPLRSRFTLSYNTVLNLIRSRSEQEIADILRKNFAAYQGERERARLAAHLEAARRRLKELEAQGAGKARRKALRRVQELERELDEPSPAERHAREFEAKRQLLAELEFVRGDTLTARGEFAARVNIQELLVTELYFDGWFHRLDPDQINALAVSVDYEPRKAEGRYPHNAFDVKAVENVVERIAALERRFLGTVTVRFHDHVAALAYRWSRGETFSGLLKGAYQDEGDIVYALRRGIDLLRQVRFAAAEDPVVRTKLEECMERMDRDEVAVLL